MDPVFGGLPDQPAPAPAPAPPAQGSGAVPPGPAAPQLAPNIPVVHTTGCMNCGSEPSDAFTFRRTTGMIFRAGIETTKGKFCGPCAQSVGRQKQNQTMMFGWWGVFAFFANIWTIAMNAVGLLKASKMDANSNEGTLDPGRPVLLRFGTIVPVALALLIGYWVLFAPRIRQVDNLGPGDCVMNSDDDLISSLRLVDCNKPHDAEVFAQVTVGTFAESYPGLDEVSDRTLAECVRLVEAYIGQDFIESPYNISWLSPSEDGWESTARDRTATCLVVNNDGSQLTAPAKANA